MNVVEHASQNALEDWAEEITRYQDLEGASAAAKQLSRVSGLRWTVLGHPHESAADQRSALAHAVAAEIDSRDLIVIPRLMLFDTYWQPATAVNRRLGGKRLVERYRRKYGLRCRVADISRIDGEATMRWSVLVDLDRSELGLALAALEHSSVAMTLSAGIDDPAVLLKDLFEDEEGVLTTRPQWPLWAARRSDAGDGVVLAEEFNDHSGRQAFLLGLPQQPAD